MSERIEGVTLDAAGTLIGVARPVGATYAEIARDAGAVLDSEALARGFREVFPRMRPMAFGPLTGDDLEAAERAWWQALVREVTERAGGVRDFDAYFERLYAHYAAGRAWRVYSEVPAVLARLAARGIPVAVVSNFDSRLPRILDELRLSERVRAIVHSSAAGAAKPDARIFRRAVEALGTAPARTLHAGDSYEADYLGALRAGLQAVHVVRGKAAPGAAETPRVPDLTGLDAIVDRSRAAAPG